MLLIKSLALLVCIHGMLGCTMPSEKGDAGIRTNYVGPVHSALPTGVGIESGDIINMTDRMMRDILASSFFGQLKKTPRVVIDGKYFINESSTRINKNMITDRLRIGLNKFGKGKMVFVSRERMGLVLHEKMLAQSGLTADDGTMADSQLTGADYRLAGRIAALDSVDPRTGVQSRYHQILFEIIELKSGAIVWTDSYDFKKVGQEDIIYR